MVLPLLVENILADRHLADTMPVQLSTLPIGQEIAGQMSKGLMIFNQKR